MLKRYEELKAELREVTRDYNRLKKSNRKLVRNYMRVVKERDMYYEETENLRDDLMFCDLASTVSVMQRQMTTA